MRVFRLFFIGQVVTLKALTLPWEGFLHFAVVVHPGYRPWRPEWDGPPQQARLRYDPTRSMSLNLHWSRRDIEGSNPTLGGFLTLCRSGTSGLQALETRMGWSSSTSSALL